MNRDYKLNNSRTKLPRMNHSQILNNNFKKTKDGTLKPKVHLRYGRLSDIKNKGTLISTIIEEHLLKFGFLMTYDHYIKEYAMRNAFKKDAEEKFFKLSEIKDIIIKVRVGSFHMIFNLEVLHPEFYVWEIYEH